MKTRILLPSLTKSKDSLTSKPTLKKKTETTMRQKGRELSSFVSHILTKSKICRGQSRTRRGILRVLGGKKNRVGKAADAYNRTLADMSEDDLDDFSLDSDDSFDGDAE